MVDRNPILSAPLGPFQKARLIYRAHRYRWRSEKGPTHFVLEFLRPGHRVIDVGANKGAYVYWFCRCVGPTGRVLALEPQPELAEYLNAAGQAFGFSQLTVVQAAASSRSGISRLTRPDHNPSGGATLQTDVFPDGMSFDVPLVMLDDLVESQRMQRVDLIKCDVQGHEFEVFRGGERILRRDGPVLVFECSDFFHSSEQIARIFKFLNELGYEGHFFERSGAMRPIAEFDLKAQQGDYFSMHYAHDFMFRPSPG